MDSWLNPTLSLQTEIHRERDRRAAVKLSLQELQQVTDNLIVQWYQQKQLIDCAMRRVCSLEVELMLAEAGPARHGPSARHMEMAREVLAELADQGTPSA